ncbi:MAG: hypothetical protein WCL21_04955, partial [Mariniphaga sp.]
MTNGKDKPVIVHIIGPIGPKIDDSARAAEISGLAVLDGLCVVSLPLKNQLIFVDAHKGVVIGTTPLEAPRGLAFDANGCLLALSGKNLVRFSKITDPTKIPAPQTVVTALSAPAAVTLDNQGNLYISDRGTSHQVKVFTAKGKFL